VEPSTLHRWAWNPSPHTEDNKSGATDSHSICADNNGSSSPQRSAGLTRLSDSGLWENSWAFFRGTDN
jgi:hypothetical protein